MFEKYLTHVSNNSDRRHLARFRTSSHKLLTEYGRYTTPKTPIADRICAQCPMEVTEDERYFLMICPKYVSHRFLVTKHLINNPSFACQSSMSKFIWLLGNENASVCNDFARFIIVCFSLRE